MNALPRLSRPRPSTVGLFALVVLALGFAVYSLGPSAPESDAVGTTLIIHKDFVPDSASGSVSISITCTGGALASPSTGTVTEAAPLTSTISNFGLSTTCTATEGTPPAGYTSVEANCLSVLIVLNTTSNCTITNIQTSATFVVYKDFVPDNQFAVAVVSVTCTNGGIPTPPVGVGTEATPFTTNVTGFSSGATCSATAGVTPDYTAHATNCQDVPIAIGGTSSCTIVITQNTTTFSVNKNFIPDNALGAVTVAVSCTSGVAVPPSGVATEASAFTTTVTAFTPGATCSATEGVAPPGYTADETACQNVPIGIVGPSNCTLKNTLNTATFTVSKDFDPDNPVGLVTMSVTCTNGGIAVPPSGLANELVPFTTTVVGFTAGATCTATEAIGFPGYTADASACQSIPIFVSGSSGCTITNTLNTATFTVNKDFDPDNALGAVFIALTCTNGGIAIPPGGVATETAPFVTTVVAFEPGATCTATEGVAPAGYTAHETACLNVVISVGGSSSCTITNTQNTATFTVNKDFDPDNALGAVTIAVTCTSGLAVPPAGIATEASPFTTTVVGFTVGATCTATEGVAPSGYTANETNCQSVAISVGGSSSCTITNTLNTAPFAVHKDFVPDNVLGTVTIALSCSNGGIAVPPISVASEATPASFTVVAFDGDPTCTATETPIPVGYSSSGVCSALISVGTCTITNTLRTATLIVNKDFIPNSSDPVTVTVLCSSGIPLPLTGPAAEGSPFVTTITGFNTGATCIATELPVAGYLTDQLNCALVPITEGGVSSCTIVNTKLCPNPSPPWPVPPGDADCDGFPDTMSIAAPNALASETYLGTNPLMHCALTNARNDEPSPDAWPVDPDDNQMVNGSDLLMFAPSFWSVGPLAPFDVRYDLNADGRINGSDLLKVSPFFLKSCS